MSPTPLAHLNTIREEIRAEAVGEAVLGVMVQALDAEPKPLRLRRWVALVALMFASGFFFGWGCGERLPGNCDGHGNGAGYSTTCRFQ